MNEFTDIADFPINGEYEKRIIESCLNSLSDFPGVESAGFDNDELQVEYYRQLISEKELREQIGRMGVHLLNPDITVEEKEKNPIKRYINKLAARNEKRYGKQRLDCCDLHKDQ